LDATLIVFGWFGVQCVLYVLPVGGELVDGLPVKETGVKLKYRLNAFFVLTLNILGLLAAIVSGFNVTMVQLSMQSVHITTKIVSSNPAHGEVYSIQHYVIKFVSDLRQFGGFLRVFPFPAPIKLTATSLS
jgi:hypothetical protein